MDRQRAQGLKRKTYATVFVSELELAVDYCRRYAQVELSCCNRKSIVVVKTKLPPDIFCGPPNARTLTHPCSLALPPPITESSTSSTSLTTPCAFPIHNDSDVHFRHHGAPSFHNRSPQRMVHILEFPIRLFRPDVRRPAAASTAATKCEE